MKDHYETLGVSPRSEIEVIQAAYKALMRKYHPDQNVSDAHGSRAREVNEAFRVLGNEARRREYDRARRMDMFARSPAWTDPAPSPRPVSRAAHAFRHGRLPTWIWAGIAFGAVLGLVSLAPLAETAFSADLKASAAQTDGPVLLVAGRAAASDPAMAGASPLSANLGCAHLPAVEQRVCANAELAAREVQLARHYHDLEDRLHGRKRDALRESQTNWTSQRDLCRTDSCIAQAYDERIAVLTTMEIPPTPSATSLLRFNCDLALSWAQEVVCRDPVLAGKDVEIARLHARLRDRLPGTEFLALRDSQADWIRARNACLTEACIADAYERRTTGLAAQLRRQLGQ